MNGLSINVPDTIITQIKVFVNNNAELLEREINEFCKTNSVCNIKFQFCEWDHTYRVIVVYRTFSEGDK